MTPTASSTRRAFTASLIPLLPAVPGLGVGAVLGFNAGYESSRGGMAGLGALGIWFIVAALAAVIAVVGAILFATGASRGGGRALAVCAAGLAVGAIAGSAAVPAFGLGYEPPVFLRSSGSAALELDGQSAFVAFDAGAVDCWSVADDEAVETVWALELGELEGGTVRATIYPADGQPEIELFIDGADTNPGVQPFWSRAATLDAVMSADERGGSVAFSGLSLPQPIGGWPASLSGRLTWSCDPWRDPTLTPAPEASGQVALELPGQALRLDGRVDAPCEYEADGSVLGITTGGGYLLNDWPISVRLSLWGELRIGGELQLEIVGTGKNPPPGERFLPSWTGFAVVEDLGDGERTGTARFEELAPGADPAIGPPPAGWPTTLTGTVGWSCP